MKTFILKLDPQLREELYTDISENFIGYVLIEAIFNIIQAPSPFALEDVDYHPNDPDSTFETSVEYLLNILEKFFPEDVMLDEEEDDMLASLDHHTWIGQTLSTAINCVNNANDYLTLFSVSGLLLSPEYMESYNFGARHLDTQVIFSIWEDSESCISTGIKELLGAD